jgi:hypothetical protein
MTSLASNPSQRGRKGCSDSQGTCLGRGQVKMLRGPSGHGMGVGLGVGGVRLRQPGGLQGLPAPFSMVESRAGVGLGSSVDKRQLPLLSGAMAVVPTPGPISERAWQAELGKAEHF